jgi:hypothetical protein
MTAQPFKARAYVLRGCPFSFKFWLFMIEARLDEQIEVLLCDSEQPDFGAVKTKLAAATGKAASFPTVEVEPGRYLADSDVLIGWYAQRNSVHVSRLPALAFYKETLFPQIVELHKQASAGQR